MSDSQDDALIGRGVVARGRWRRARRRRSRRRERRRAADDPDAALEGGLRRSTRTSRKARTPTTSRRSRRSTPNLFGIALVTVDGKVYTVGDVKSEVSIQSISKVFTLARVFQESGAEAIVEQHRRRRDRPGRSTRSSRSSSTRAQEMNPLVNAGAIATTSMVKGANARRGLEEHHRRRTSDFAGRQLDGEPGGLQVRGRRPTSATRRSATLMYAYGHIKANPMQATDLYTRAVLGQRQRERPRDDGGDARQRRQEPGHRQAGRSTREHVPERARGDGDRRASTTTPASGCSRPACPARAASAAGSSRCRPASSASP